MLRFVVRVVMWTTRGRVECAFFDDGFAESLLALPIGWPMDLLWVTKLLVRLARVRLRGFNFYALCKDQHQLRASRQ